MSRAFTLRQQLDDDVPEDEPTTRQMLGEMLRLTDAADARMDEQAEAFARLRDLENTAPQVLEALAPRIAELRGRIAQAERQLAELQQRFAPSAVSSVADNVPEAQARLAAAEQEVNEALDALGAGRPGDAVGDIRAAEDAVAQTATLLDAIGRLATDLDAAAERVVDVRAETEKDLAEARALVSVGRQRHPAAADRARRGGAGLRRRAAAAGRRLAPDPLAALRQLEEADIALEQALSVARDAQAQVRRAAAALDQAVLTARSTIEAATDFIDTRRGAVGPEARTRLAEAQRHLDVAVDQGRDDPVGALREAHQAATMAQAALDRAQDDVSQWSAAAATEAASVVLPAASPADTAVAGASTWAAWCSAGSCSAAAGAAGSAVVVAGSAAASAAGTRGAAAGPAGAASAAGVVAAAAAAASDATGGSCGAPWELSVPGGTVLLSTTEEMRCPHATPHGPTGRPAGSTTARPTSRPRRPSTRPSWAGSTPEASPSSVATSP